MPKARTKLTPILSRPDDHSVDRNLRRSLQAVDKQFASLSPAAGGQIITVNLVIGNNKIRPPISKPSGRILLSQSDPAFLSDKGLDSDGNWVIAAGSPCTVRLSFFRE